MPKIGWNNAYSVRGGRAHGGQLSAERLNEAGFIVDGAQTGIDALHMAETGDDDLIVLEVLHPGMDGWPVIQELCKTKETPVLFLNPKDEAKHHAKGLELGADHYLVRPFAFAELVVRIRALLQRGPILDADCVEVGALEIDLLKRRVTRNGDRIDLTAKEFALLHLLAKHKGALLSPSLIVSQVWDLNFGSNTNAVDVAIRWLW